MEVRAFSSCARLEWERLDKIPNARQRLRRIFDKFDTLCSLPNFFTPLRLTGLTAAMVRGKNFGIGSKIDYNTIGVRGQACSCRDGVIVDPRAVARLFLCCVFSVVRRESEPLSSTSINFFNRCCISPESFS